MLLLHASHNSPPGAGRYDIVILMQTIEAIVESNGAIRILEDVKFPANRRALITILDEEPAANRISDEEFEADMLALAEDGNSSNYLGSYSREDIYFDHD